MPDDQVKLAVAILPVHESIHGQHIDAPIVATQE
jgi:hypothetical protein